jgi:serine/threonine-protein kinase
MTSPNLKAEPQPNPCPKPGFAGRDAFAEGLLSAESQFTLHDLLGKGGMAKIYTATDGTGRTVALKLFKKLPKGHSQEHLTDWFIRECAANLLLSHPNIIRAFEAGEARNHLYISMEKLDGKTLHSHLSSKHGMGWEVSRRFFVQISQALEEIHRAGVVHRDLKPENITLAKGPGGLAAKIIDFGLCHIADYEDVYPHISSGPGEPRVTPRSGEFATPEFRPPEYDTPGASYTPLFDIYSAGLVFYNLAAGDLPFRMQTFERARDRSAYYSNIHKCAVFPAPTIIDHSVDIPGRAEDAIMACLDKNPGGRPGAAELRKIFESC